MVSTIVLLIAYFFLAFLGSIEVGVLSGFQISQVVAFGGIFASLCLIHLIIWFLFLRKQNPWNDPRPDAKSAFIIGQQRKRG